LFPLDKDENVPVDPEDYVALLEWAEVGVKAGLG